MAKLKSIKKHAELERVPERSDELPSDAALVRRMSASSDGAKSEASEQNRNDLVDMYRSTSEPGKRKKKPKIWDFFDWSFKNVSYERMSPENKKWLVFYKSMSYLGILLLIAAYTFFIILLFSYLIYVNEGEIVDEELFVPVKESLLHSLVTMWHQRAYFVVFVIFFFSISLPFIKMIATILAYVITARHRKKQIHLFFGDRVAPRTRGRYSGEEDGSIELSDVDDFALYEDGRLIKYAREVLLILKLISKFQMVDIIILLVNIAFLRSAFVWAKPGEGLLYLFIYCVCSIMGTQLLNLAVEGERDIFEYWRAVRFLCLPTVTHYYSNNFHNSLAISGPSGIKSSNLGFTSVERANEDLNDTSAADIDRPTALEMHNGLEALANAGVTERTSMFNIMNRNSGLDVMSNATSEVDYYDMLYTTKKDIKVRWYRSGIFVTVMVILNVISGCLIVSNEKLFAVAFTPDAEKIFGVDGTQMTFFEIVLSIRDCWNYLPVFVFFFLSVIVPILFHVLFMTGLFLYNFAISNKDCNAISTFDPGKPLLSPYHCLNTSVKITKFIFNFCNILSEWALGEVLSLGLLAAYFSLSSAANVRFYIPPKKICSPFALLGTFGITSLLINIQFFMWHTRIINRLSDVTIFIESINSARSTTDGSPQSTTHLNLLETPARAGLVIKDSKDNLQRLESHIEASRNDIVYHPDQRPEARKRISFRRWLFKFIDFVRHIMYSKIIISIFFSVLFLIALYFFIFSFVVKNNPTPVDEKKIEEFMNFGVPNLFSVLKRNLPSSFGDCLNKYPPTKPCIGDAPLLTYPGPFKIELIWISGINSINLIDSKFLITGDNRMQFRFHVKFGALRPFTRFSTCFENSCTVLFAGDHMCCGDDVHIVTVVSASCSDTAPYFRDIKMDELKIRNLKFKNELYFLLNTVIKFQDLIERRLLAFINDFLDKQEDIMQWRGLNFSAVGFINYLLSLNFPAGITCGLKLS